MPSKKSVDAETFWISVDPGSHSIGIALWLGESYLCSQTFTAKKGDWIDRMQGLKHQVSVWLAIKTSNQDLAYAVSERMPPRGMLALTTTQLQSAIGAIVTAYSQTRGQLLYVPVQSWKGFVRRHGTNVPAEVKGVAALASLGWDFQNLPVQSDDEADAILIGLTHREMTKNVQPQKRSRAGKRAV